MDDILGNKSTFRRLFPGDEYESKVHFTGDQDWFWTFGLPGITYEVMLRAISGNPLPDPQLSIRDINGDVLIDQYDSRPGKWARIRFTVENRDRIHVAATNRGPETGYYRISMRSLTDDYANNVRGAGQITIENGMGAATGVIEQRTDQDWFQVKLKPQTWYEFKVSNGQALFLRNKNKRQVTRHDEHDRYFNNNGGIHYVVVRQHRYRTIFGEYNVTVKEGEKPYLSLENGAQYTGVTRLSSLLSTNEFPITSYHIYSDSNLRFGNQYYQNHTVQEANKIYRATKDNLWRWTTLRDGKKFSKIWVRGITDNDVQTPWVRLNVTARDAGLLLGDNRWFQSGPNARELTFSFATDLPSYFTGDSRFPTFEALTSGQMSSMREAIRRWSTIQSSLTFKEVAPNATNDNADIMIFKSDIDKHVLGLAPGGNGGSDIILDQNSPILHDLRYGREGFFQLLRGVGSSLGLVEDDTFLRTESVMGSKQYYSPRYYPTSPGPYDVAALTDHYDRFSYNKITSRKSGDSTYKFVKNHANTIIDTGGFDTIDGQGEYPVWIDLRPGATSELQVDSIEAGSLSISLDSRIEKAIGGDSHDVLRGDGLDNVLVGNGHIDYLEGGPGDDRLYGGEDNDRYGFYLGDGHDTIDEMQSGGLDRIYIDGMFTFNNFSDDMTFRKLNDGKDLEINISMDGVDDNRQGSIVIKNMYQRKSQVENLKAFNPNRKIADISLRSLWEHATPDLQRFRILGRQDIYGNHVIPIPG